MSQLYPAIAIANGINTSNIRFHLVVNRNSPSFVVNTCLVQAQGFDSGFSADCHQYPLSRQLFFTTLRFDDNQSLTTLLSYFCHYCVSENINAFFL